MRQDLTNIGVKNKHPMLVDAASTNAELVLDVSAKYDELKIKYEKVENQLHEYKTKEKYGHEDNNASSPDTNGSANVLPVISYEEMMKNNAEVKRRKGMQSLAHLISYALLSCNGDYNQMTRNQSYLTWLKEWFLCFEYVWGRTLQQWINAAAVYKSSVRTVRRVFHQKLEILFLSDQYSFFNSKHIFN